MFVSPQRFLIVGLLKTDNSLRLIQSVFLTQPLIRNLYPTKKRINFEVSEIARLVWLRQTLLYWSLFSKEGVKSTISSIFVNEGGVKNWS